jgi:hypothetical protein
LGHDDKRHWHPVDNHAGVGVSDGH